MMQLVGYRMWAENPRSEQIALADARHGIELAKREMIEGILEYTYRELSDGDKRFLAAMLPDSQDSSLAAISRRMGVKSNYASQYKRRPASPRASSANTAKDTCASTCRCFEIISSRG